ncbi:MAG: ABC transporter permease [Thermodesulfobacteriota bacterium]
MNSPKTDKDKSSSKPGRLGWLAGRESLPFLAATAILFIAFSLAEPRFLNAYNLLNILRNSSYLIIISLGQMLALVVGGFDLAVGAVVALSSITSALAMVYLKSVFPGQVVLIISLALLAALAAGTAVGLANGLCVAWLKVPPFIVTLGTMSVTNGIVLYLTNGIPIYGMPEEFIIWFGRARWLGLPIPIYVMLVVLIGMYWLMNWTLSGRYMYAIGGNPHAARVSGIRVNIHTATAYVICAVLSAVTGVLLTARVGSGEGTMGGELIMQSIAAAVIGGVSIGGGVGRVELVAVGAIFLTLVTNGMNLAQVDSKLQTIVVGVILMIAVAFDQFRRRRQEDYRP